MTTPAPVAAVERLRRIVNATDVLTDADMTAGYEQDWTGRWRGRALAVVRPRTTQEVAAIVRSCAEMGIAVIPQGGNTGLVGGATPRGGEVVLSTSRLDHLGAVDQTAGDVIAGAGVTLARLQSHASLAGLRFPVDIAARESCTVGGMIATDAGGVHVVRYGSMRHQVLGIEAVLADGTILDLLHRNPKDAGYDLVGLLCGSEGTLAVVTTARLRLLGPLAHRLTALVGVDGIDRALEVLSSVRPLPSLEAVELMFDDGIALVASHRQCQQPLPRPYPCVLLIECADLIDPTPALQAALEPVTDEDASAIACDSRGRSALWAWRELHPEAVSRAGIPHKLDVSVPLQQLSAFIPKVRAAVRRLSPGAMCLIWGHLNEGNLHININGVAPDDPRVDDVVLGLVVEHGGGVCAEHGVGTAKREWLARTRSTSEVAAMLAIKQALDPLGTFNPGALLRPPPGSLSR